METIKLDLIPSGKMPSLHASQYDDGREHGIDLFENGVVYKLDGTETLTINERKGDDCICSLDIENAFADSNHIVFFSTEQMCAVWGNNICELVIAKDEKTIGTLNFILEVEQSPTEGGIESESEIKNLERQIEAITEEVIGDNYYTAEETDEAIATAIEGKADTTYVNTELAKKADKSNTYTKTETNNLLNAKANASDVYTKSQTDNLLDNKADVSDLPDMSQYYDKSEVNTALGTKANQSDLSSLANVVSGLSDDVEALEQNKADKSDTYTKAQVDDIVYGILPDDTASGSVANFTTSLELPIKSLEVDVNAVQEAGTPTPATPLPISGWSEISLVKRGANLWDEVVELGALNSDGTLSESTTRITTDFIPVKPNQTYRQSSLSSAYGGRICFYDINKRCVRYDGNGVREYAKTFTTQDGEYYVRITLGYQYGTTYNHDISINYPSSDTEYHAYNPNGNTEVINLGGTYYGGHLTQDKDGHRQFVVTSKFATFTGANNESWNDYPAGNGFFINLITDHIIESYGDGKCNILPTSKTFSALGIVFGINSNYIFLMQVKNSWNISTINELRDFLSVNNLQVVYTLAEPIIIDLPDGEPIITLNGTNNIYADTGDCAVEYKVSVEQYVSNHSGGGLGGGLLGLGGAKSGGSEEEPTEESEEPKEVTKTLGDEPISKK